VEIRKFLFCTSVLNKGADAAFCEILRKDLDSFQSSVCERIMEAVVDRNNGHERQIISLSQDSFYRELNQAESVQAQKGTFNFDHPGT
jgi:hypothetical protein